MRKIMTMPMLNANLSTEFMKMRARSVPELSWHWLAS
jgi:hypothetical protein